MVDPYTGTPTWDGSPPDLGLAVEWFLDTTSEPSRDRAVPRYDFSSTPVTTPSAPMPPRPKWRDPWLAAVSDPDYFDDEED